MTRALALFGAAVLAIGVTALGAAASSGSGKPTTGKSFTFHLIEKDQGFTFIDNPPRQANEEQPPSLGDQLAFSSELLTRSGKHAGLLDATCIVTRGGSHPMGPCYGLFRLKGGRLALMATIDFSKDVTRIAIVGGTGVYEGATGSIVSVSRNNGSADTVHLRLP